MVLRLVLLHEHTEDLESGIWELEFCISVAREFCILIYALTSQSLMRGVF